MLVGYLTGIGFAPGAPAESFQKYWRRSQLVAGHSSLPHGLLACVSHGCWTGLPKQVLLMAGG
jgi:hypothetical protein